MAELDHVNPPHYDANLFSHSLLLSLLLAPPPLSGFNNHLRKKSYPPIENPATDFESGIKLMQIVNALYDVPIPKHNANPKLRPHKLDNIETALKMVEQARIKTNFLKHTHLIDHDNKMILGMMWAIILDYGKGFHT